MFIIMLRYSCGCTSFDNVSFEDWIEELIGNVTRKMLNI